MMVDSTEEEAKKRMLARLNEGPVSRRARDEPTRDAGPDVPKAMQRHEQEQEARKRMLSLMGSKGSDKLKRGMGAYGGFGAEDDEDYGYGPPRRREQPEEVDLATGKPLNERIEEEMQGMLDPRRSVEWRRKAELIDPNPPPMANTLRAPGQRPTPEQVQEGLREEDSLLEALKSAVDNP